MQSSISGKVQSPGKKKLNSDVSRKYVIEYGAEDPERKNCADCQAETSGSFHGVAALHVDMSSLFSMLLPYLLHISTLSHYSSYWRTYSGIF